MAQKEPFQATAASPPGARDIASENDELRAQLRKFMQAAEKNALIFQKTQEREIELLQAEGLPDLLHILVERFAESYLLDAVTLVLQDPEHEIRHLLLAEGHRPENFANVMLVDRLTGRAPSSVLDVRPWLGAFNPNEHRALFPRVRLLKSIAVIPLLRQHRLIGVLCFGSVNPKRFTRQHATDFLGYLGIIAAVCIENAVNHQRLLRSGITDFLTGAHNRRYLHTRMKEEVARARRQGVSVACLMLDVDYFKPINDSYGHLAGDEMLRTLAERVSSQIRASDTLARFGGDEFCVLLPGANLEEARQLTERIYHSVCSAPVDLGEGRYHPLSISVGVAALQPPAKGAELGVLADRLMAAADGALYQAKAEGRGRYALMDEPIKVE